MRIDKIIVSWLKIKTKRNTLFFKDRISYIAFNFFNFNTLSHKVKYYINYKNVWNLSVSRHFFIYFLLKHYLFMRHKINLTNMFHWIPCDQFGYKSRKEYYCYIYLYNRKIVFNYIWKHSSSSSYTSQLTFKCDI